MTRAGFIYVAGPVLTIAMLSVPVIARTSVHQDPQAPPPVTGSAQPGSAPRAKVTSPHGPLSMPCQNCHTNSGWKPIRALPEFNHDQTSYPLRGMHAKVACTQCHTNMVFKKVSTQCSECHADIHRRQFGANCESCHTVRGWQINIQQIQNHQNRFPLVGAHALVECDQCHKNAAAGQFVGLSTACYSCHQQDFLTPVINHVALNFPTTCETCHSINNFVSAKFDHLKFTGYALTGAHATLECTACHINNVFTGAPAQCYACHTADFVNSSNPPHVQLGLPHDCGTCHNTTGWNNALFDHALYGHYPLTGAHVTMACATCHTNNNYSGTLPTACYGCHQADYNNATNPPHKGFPNDCTQCHNTSSWTSAAFNHNSTSFPLTGAHVTVPCASCHTNNNYSGSLPTACYGCHQADFTGTTNPPHVSSGFPTDCTQCHNTTSWTTSTFNHNNTSFPLTGFHATMTCVQCHTTAASYNGSLPTACYGCHQADFNGTTNPPHVATGFPTDCTICHSTTNWTTSTFNHSTTSFPLTGFHATMACVQCHTSATTYNGSLPTLCSGCHMADYNGTTNPAHAASHFPTTCDTCHTTTSWAGAVFNHNNTPFPLTGFHVNVPCTSCHINNVFAGTPTLCSACHMADYTGTTNPNHASAGWPTTCDTCHTTTAWLPATLPTAYHTLFPVNHGNANGVCTTCHTNSADYSVFTCTSCHGNNNSANFKHPNVNGYVYNSVNCYACHKNGGGG